MLQDHQTVLGDYPVLRLDNGLGEIRFRPEKACKGTIWQEPRVSASNTSRCAWADDDREEYRPDAASLMYSGEAADL